jgi:hypothetical protein
VINATLTNLLDLGIATCKYLSNLFFYRCKRCVLKYDHHCMVLGNCIGQHNFKYFILLQFWTFCAGVNLLFWFIFGIKKYGFGSDETLFFWVQYVIPIIFVSLLSVGSFGQFLSNFYFAWKNRTQIEIMEDMKHNIFDHGNVMENLKDVFGDSNNIVMWLFPIEWGQRTTDGHNYYFHYYST